MSATLGVLLKELQPDLTIEIFEGLDGVATESSDAWNNAGTGHAALCELNYTPQNADGSVDPSKALHINESFKISEQLWSYLVEKNHLPSPESFIHRIPHLSFVHGAKNVDYLRKRQQALAANHLFESMRFSTEPDELAEWMPLVMEGRDKAEAVAATRVSLGTDVNFGALTRSLIAYLGGLEGVSVHLRHEILNLHRDAGSGGSRSTTRRPTRNERSARSSFSSARAAGRCRCCKNRAFAKGAALGAFPSADNGCAAKTRP